MERTLLLAALSSGESIECMLKNEIKVTGRRQKDISGFIHEHLHTNTNKKKTFYFQKRKCNMYLSFFACSTTDCVHDTVVSITEGIKTW